MKHRMPQKAHKCQCSVIKAVLLPVMKYLRGPHNYTMFTFCHPSRLDLLFMCSISLFAASVLSSSMVTQAELFPGLLKGH